MARNLKEVGQTTTDSWDGYIYDFTTILEANLDPDETFIWDLDFPDLVNSRCRHKVYENMDMESQDPRFSANLGLDQNSIWTKNLRCSHSSSLPLKKNLAQSGQLPSSFLQTFGPGSQTEPATFLSGTILPVHKKLDKMSKNCTNISHLKK